MSNNNETLVYKIVHLMFNDLCNQTYKIRYDRYEYNQ